MTLGTLNAYIYFEFRYVIIFNKYYFSVNSIFSCLFFFFNVSENLPLDYVSDKVFYTIIYEYRLMI